jgi:hypothetical protein
VIFSVFHGDPCKATWSKLGFQFLTSYNVLVLFPCLSPILDYLVIEVTKVSRTEDIRLLESDMSNFDPRVSQLWNDKFVEDRTLASLLPPSAETGIYDLPPSNLSCLFPPSSPSLLACPPSDHPAVTDMNDSPETALYFIFMYDQTSAANEFF